MKGTNQRYAFSLLELMVVVAILAVALGLLFAGVQRIRDSAHRVQSTNNLKQIALAIHHFSDGHRGRLPTVGAWQPPTVYVNSMVLVYPAVNAPSLFWRILPYVEQGNQAAGKEYTTVGVFVSPADPTASTGLSKGEPLCSYAANGVVFKDNTRRMPASFSDGMSNTIAFAERYTRCGNVKFEYPNWNLNEYRPAFADYGQIVPLTKGDPPQSWPSQDGLMPPQVTSELFTFQAAPSASKCDAGLAQTPHASGMLVALADGSVRQIAPAISVTTYWGLVTPASNELIATDW
jgi:prepilin-type N-terminal cleavage/methylation domain-containing protein